MDYYADKIRGEVLVNAISQIIPENNYANPQKLCYTNNKNNQSRTMVMTWQVKVTGAKPHHCLYLIPGTHTTGENRPPKLSSDSIQMLRHKCSYT